MKKIMLIFAMFISICFADSQFVDNAKSEKAEIVLRVKFIENIGGSKYHWDKVKILKVIKLIQRIELNKILEVAHLSNKQGIPKGISTIYLEKYNPDKMEHWKLLNGNGTDGVSHNQKNP